MSVELKPKGNCFCFGVANGTWFTLLEKAGLGTVLPALKTNDPITATRKQAMQCAELVEKWTPPADWYCRDREQEGKAMFVEFFRKCGGFTTD